MTDKKKLAELIRKAELSMWGKSFGSALAENYYIAEYLIENGVIIPIRCSECKHKISWYKHQIYGSDICGVSGMAIKENMDFCSYGERKE